MEYWQALPGAQQIFSGMAILFSGLLFVLLILALIGKDLDADTDLDTSGLFSIKGVLTLLSFFGFGGWIASRFGAPLWMALIVGSLVGYACMSLVLYLMSRLRGFDSDGTRRRQTLLGQHGDVYLPIPAAGQGVGRLQIIHDGRLVDIEAASEEGPIATGERVEVVDFLDDNCVLVRAVDPPELAGAEDEPQ